MRPSRLRAGKRLPISAQGGCAFCVAPRSARGIVGSAAASFPAGVKALTKVALVVGIAAAAAAAWQIAMRPEPVRVVLHEVSRGLVEAVAVNTRAGTVQARRRARLSPGQGGLVARLHAREGDRVQPGELLVELWCEDVLAQLQVAEGELQRAEAQWEGARLRHELAERDAARLRLLAAQDIAAKERSDEADIEAGALAAAARAAHSERDVRARAVVLVEAQLDRLSVRAPFSGVVAEVNGEVGEFVTPSPIGVLTPPVVDLIDDSSPFVTAPIDEVDAAAVAVGMAVRITLDAFADREFSGRVSRIAPYVLDQERQARTVDVEVDFVGAPDAALLVGYSADVEIQLDRREQALRVPREAVRDGSVLLWGADRRLRLQQVQVGLQNWRWCEVVAGVAEGESVVVSRDRAGVAAGALAAPAEERGP